MAELAINVTKAKAKIMIDPDQLPDDVYKEALSQGLQVLLNRSMTKITVSGLEGEQLEAARAAAMAQAEKNRADLLAGKVRKTATKGAGKVAGAVMTEARRIARALVKDEMKRQDIKVSYVAPKDITAAANALIEANPEILKQAESNLAERASKTEAGIGIDLKSLVKEDPKKVKAAEEKKAKAKEQLSKTQAAMVAPRAKKGAETHAQH